MNSNPDCLFCKIRDGVIPSHKVYEDDDVFAFLDINPVNPGHVLIMPKGHYENTTETPDELVSKLAIVTKKIAQAVMKATGSPAYNIEVNSGEIAGQVIMHTHWHIIPRHEGDGLKHWQGKSYGEGEDEAMAKKIISNF